MFWKSIKMLPVMAFINDDIYYKMKKITSRKNFEVYYYDIHTLSTDILEVMKLDYIVLNH